MKKQMIKIIKMSIFLKELLMIKIGTLQQHSKRIYLALMAFILLPQSMWAKTLEEMIRTITDALDNGIIKAIGTLVIIALAVYTIKNYERWKEIIVMVITILVGVVCIMNANRISDAIFG